MADFSILNSTKIRPFESKFAENDEFRILMMNLSFRVMNFVFKMMDFASTMMNFVLKMMI